MLTAKLHDGSEIEVVITGEGPNLLLPVNPYPVIGPEQRKCSNGGRSGTGTFTDRRAQR